MSASCSYKIVLIKKTCIFSYLPQDISGSSSHIDIEDQSEEESESESEYTTFDDCVKCICQDECDTGFMIQVKLRQLVSLSLKLYATTDLLYNTLDRVSLYFPSNGR